MALRMGLLRAVSPARVHLLTAPWPFLPYQYAHTASTAIKPKTLQQSRLLQEIFGCDMTLPSPAPSSRQRAYSEHKYLCLPLLFLSKLVLFLPVYFFFPFYCGSVLLRGARAVLSSNRSCQAPTVLPGRELRHKAAAAGRWR